MPTSSSIGTVRPDLNGVLSVGPRMYVPFREFVSPSNPVSSDRGAFYKVNVEMATRIGDIQWASKSDPPRNTFDYTQDTYQTVRKGTSDVIDPLDRAVTAAKFDLEEIAAMQQMDILRRQGDIELMAAVTAGVTGTAAAATWSTTGDPTTDINAAITAVVTGGRPKPNRVIMGLAAYQATCSNTNVRDRLKYVERTPLAIPLSDLAALFGVDEVFVADGTYNAAKEGQSASMTSVWTSTVAMVFYAENTPWGDRINAPSLFRTMVFEGAGIPFAEGGGTVATADLPRGQVEVIAYENRQFKLIDAGCGRRITGVV